MKYYLIVGEASGDLHASHLMAALKEEDPQADAESLKKYFAANAKALLDKGVRIEQVNGIKTLFSVSPANGSYKVNFGEEEFMNYFKEFLRPQLVEMLF